MGPVMNSSNVTNAAGTDLKTCWSVGFPCHKHFVVGYLKRLLTESLKLHFMHALQTLHSPCNVKKVNLLMLHIVDITGHRDQPQLNW